MARDLFFDRNARAALGDPLLDFHVQVIAEVLACADGRAALGAVGLGELEPVDLHDPAHATEHGETVPTPRERIGDHGEAQRLIRRELAGAAAKEHA